MNLFNTNNIDIINNCRQYFMLNCLVVSGLIVLVGLRKVCYMQQYFMQNFSFSSIACIYLLVKFLFCLFFSVLFCAHLVPFTANKDVNNW